MDRGHGVQPSRPRSSVRQLMAVNPQDRLFSKVDNQDISSELMVEI